MQACVAAWGSGRNSRDLFPSIEPSYTQALGMIAWSQSLPCAEDGGEQQSGLHIHRLRANRRSRALDTLEQSGSDDRLRKWETMS